MFSRRYFASGLFALMAMTLAGPSVAQTGPEDLVTDQATLDAIMAKGIEICGEAPRKAPPGNTWKFYAPATGLGKKYYFAGGDDISVPKILTASSGRGADTTILAAPVRAALAVNPGTEWWAPSFPWTEPPGTGNSFGMPTRRGPRTSWSR